MALFSVLASLILAGPSAHALDCLRGVTLTADSAPIGVETIHRTSSSVITVFMRYPRAGERVIDVNSLTMKQSLPAQFTISDGTLQSAFVRVDQTSGSTLDRCLTELAAKARARVNSKRTVLEVMKSFIAGELKEAPEDWGLGLNKTGEMPSDSIKEFRSAADLPVGHYPLKTSVEQPMIPIEMFLKEGKGACLPKVLLTSMVMRRLGIDHAVRIGGTEFSGHMWIELPDGRHLDPTWQELEGITTEGAWPGWFHFSRSFLFMDQVFPIVASGA